MCAREELSRVEDADVTIALCDVALCKSPSVPRDDDDVTDPCRRVGARNEEGDVDEEDDRDEDEDGGFARVGGDESEDGGHIWGVALDDVAHGDTEVGAGAIW